MRRLKELDRTKQWLPLLAVGGALLVGIAGNCAMAQETTADPTAQLAADLRVGVDTVWVLVTAMLVFFMNLGFACVESGFCRAKNCVNILSKNFIVFAVTSVFFWLLGLGHHVRQWHWIASARAACGSSAAPTTARPLADAYQGDYSALSWTGVPLLAKFFFQLVFAGTAATIVSGAVAERIKYISFIVFSALHGDCDLPGRRPLDLGRRLAGRQRLPRFRRLDAGPLDRRLGGAGRRLHAWPAHRQVRRRWQDHRPFPATT